MPAKVTKRKVVRKKASVEVETPVSIAMPVTQKSIWDKLAPVLLVVSIGLAFFVGILWQKVENLKGGGKVSNSGSPIAGQPQPNTFPTNGKLSADQVKKIPAVNDRDWIKGSKNAKVTIVEYSDLECPFCKRFHPTAQQAVDEYKGQVAWVYRHFPLDQIHSKADKEAEAVECAGEQKSNDGFWKLVDKIYEVTPSNNGLNHDELPKLASQVGLNQGQFKTCLDSGRYRNKVEEQYQGGITAGVTGTPGSFVINRKGEAWLVPGAVPYETLKATIEEALKS